MKLALCVLASLLVFAGAGRLAGAATVPAGFTDSLVAGGLTNPTAMALNWRVPAAMNKTHQLQARAFDQAGNVGTSSIQVTAR